FIRGHDLESRLARIAREVLRRGHGGPQQRLAAHLRGGEGRLRAQPGRGAALARTRAEVACLAHLLGEAGANGRVTVDGLERRLADLFRESDRAAALSTVHRAKGLGAQRVFLLCPELMPASHARTAQAVRGEACVQFVALTRS